MVTYNDKPNWKQAGFWVTLFSVITGILYLTGILTPDDKDSFNNNLPTAIDTVTVIAGIGAIAFRGIKKKFEKKPKPVKSKKKKAKQEKVSGNERIDEPSVGNDTEYPKSIRP